MSLIKSCTVIAPFSIALSGCGIIGGPIHTISSKDSNVILIEAKHRAILTTSAKKAGTSDKGQKPDQSTPAKKDGTSDKEQKRDLLVCAEPNPDALSSISRQLTVGGGVTVDKSGKKVSGGLDKDTSENTRQFNRHTATIQLLRDALYRQCEAYMNGLI